MFVLILTAGQWEDLSVHVVGVVESEDRAKQLVVEKTEQRRKQQAIDDLNSDLHHEGWTYFATNIEAEPLFEEQPYEKYDVSRQKDKQYNNDWIAAKRQREQERTTFHEQVIKPWWSRSQDFADQYAKDNYDESKLKYRDWLDFQFHYEPVEILE